MDYLLLLSSIVVGALTVLFFRLERSSYVKLFNAFTGAYLLCLTFLHLLPELYEHDAQHGHAHGMIGALILFGFFLQILLDSFSLGIEHGHTHHVHGGVPWGVIMGLCLHAFIEAMALGNQGQHHDPTSRRMLLTSIVVHNYPVSIALLVMLLHSGMTRGRALGFLGVFAAMAPLALLLSGHTNLAEHTRELTAVVIGIFMHMATTILFETSDVHRFNFGKIIAILLGMGLGVLTVMLH